MNTDVIVHPKLQHYGLTTSNLDAMIDWYRKVLGMTVNHRSAARSGMQRGPFSSAAFLSNDEVNHRMVLFEMSGLSPIPISTSTRACSTSPSNMERSMSCSAPMPG